MNDDVLLVVVFEENSFYYTYTYNYPIESKLIMHFSPYPTIMHSTL